MENMDGFSGLRSKVAYNQEFDNARQADLVIIYFDVNNLKHTNDTLGHRYGDKLILAVAEVLKEQFGIESSFRTGGDEFIVMTNGIGPHVIKKKIELINVKMEELTSNDEDGIIYEVASGFCVGNGILTKEKIEAQAESQMYINKKEMKRKHPERDVRNEYTQATQKQKKEKTPSDKPAVDITKAAVNVANGVANGTKKAVEEIKKTAEEIKKNAEERKLAAVDLEEPVIETRKIASVEVRKISADATFKDKEEKEINENRAKIDRIVFAFNKGSLIAIISIIGTMIALYKVLVYM